MMETIKMTTDRKDEKNGCIAAIVAINAMLNHTVPSLEYPWREIQLATSVFCLLFYILSLQCKKN